MQRVYFFKIFYFFFLLCLNLVIAGSVFAYGFVPKNNEQEACFAKAMIGMDSVINSRLGVPPEHALDLSILGAGATASKKYDEDLLTVILAAYLWKESPHSYAVNVFYDCARNERYQQQAKS